MGAICSLQVTVCAWPRPTTETSRKMRLVRTRMAECLQTVYRSSSAEHPAVDEQSHCQPRLHRIAQEVRGMRCLQDKRIAQDHLTSHPAEDGRSDVDRPGIAVHQVRKQVA